MTTKKYLVTKDMIQSSITNSPLPIAAAAVKTKTDSIDASITTLEGKTADATTTSKGVVQVGSGLSVTDGVISVSGGGGGGTYTLTASTTNLILSVSVQWGNDSGYVPIIGPTPNILYNGTISLKLENSSAQGTAYFVDSSGAVTTQSLSEGWTTCTLPSNTISIGVYAKYITGISAGCTGLYT